MPDSPTSEPESAFVCDCDEWVREACAGEPFYRELEDKRYCVLHFPGKEKSADFEQALQRKLENEDFDFSGVWFPDELSFENFEFGTEANFRDATFSAWANFYSATFSAEADFASATFSADANFRGATFSAEASFSGATFSAEANFMDATFSAEPDFRSAAFLDHVRFAGTEGRQVFTDASRLDLQFARIEKPDRVSFHTLSLRPNWFVNIDSRKFGFTNVNWDGSASTKRLAA